MGWKKRFYDCFQAQSFLTQL